MRELENTIMRAVVLSQGEELLVRDLPEKLRAHSGVMSAPVGESAQHYQIPEDGLDLDHLLADVERRWLEAALDACGGNKTRAARALKMSFRSFRYRLAKYDLDN